MVASSSAASASYFQGGDYVELLSAQGKAPASTWKLQGKIIKSFDKAIKGNAFQMDGSSETKMQLPKAPTPSSSSLGLTQRFLVFQLSVPHTRSFSIEIGFSDFQKIRRRLVFASAFRETTMTALHVQIPISSSISRDQWMNFVFDLQALTEHYFPGSSFRSMESICISGSCRLKRIFTMKDAPYCAAVEQALQLHMAAYKQQRLQSKDSNNVPIAVAGFAEMKEIPKQFVFSDGASSLSIPTEYFVAVSPIAAVGTGQAAPAQSGRSAGTKTTTNEAKASAAPKPGVVKPKTADTRVGRSRAAAPVKSPIAVGTDNELRAQSAPSARVHEPRADQSSHVYQASSKKVAPARLDSPSVNSYRTNTAPLDDPTPESIPRARKVPTDTDADDEEEGELEADTSDQDLDSQEEESRSDDVTPAQSPVYQATPPKQTDHVECRVEASLSTAAHRKIQRQNVIAEIQSKLDQLTKEATEEEERDREMFLKSVSIAGDKARQSPNADEKISSRSATLASSRKPPPISDDEPAKEWPESELLRSPEPMVLRRQQATKKPEIMFSSSIFTFDREAPTSTESNAPKNTGTNGSLRRGLFDWDSLLEDSVGSLEKSKTQPTARRDDTPAKVLSSVILPGRDPDKSAAVQGVRHSPNITKNPVKSELNDESTDDGLLEMMEAKRRARLATQRERDHHKPRDETLSREYKNSVEDDDADIDISTSPGRRSCDRGKSVPSDGSADEDHPPSPARSEADSDGDLSIDLTDNLGEKEPTDDDSQDEELPAAASPTSITSEDEDSFNFDELVVRDRDYQPPRGNQTSSSGPPPSRKSSHQRTVAPSVRPRSSEGQETKNGSRDRTHEMPTTSRTPVASSTSSPIKRSHPSKSASLGDVSSSARLMSSSQRRLASLLESTDWSQLPLSSVVSSKAPASTRESKKPTAVQPQDKRRSNGKISSSLELIYDPILRCYFDPIGKKYYTLAK